ncbi:hypothetical protein C1646_774221 [Rhizophagus diaphanus]|nr:hypothetical protein C1646_774221 [Rhizophagus diaphanus] [Rhizophagus sp. MUCL 43196]
MEIHENYDIYFDDPIPTTSIAIPPSLRVENMVRKKNKRHNQSRQSATSSLANETQSRSLTVTDTELRELICQGLVVDEVHEVLSYDRKNMPWIDNFINLSIKLENQCNDL